MSPLREVHLSPNSELVRLLTLINWQLTPVTKFQHPKFHAPGKLDFDENLTVRRNKILFRKIIETISAGFKTCLRGGLIQLSFNL